MQPPFIRRSDSSQRQGAMRAAGSGFDLGIGPCDLTFLRLDHQVRLQFGGTEVVIGCPFVLQRGEAEQHLDPHDRDGLGPWLAVYPNTLTSASVDPGATLLLAFADGTTITVRADPRYEAWQVNCPGDFLMVCAPGTSGELAVWK
jgi:hypothetical protein